MPRPDAEGLRASVGICALLWGTLSLFKAVSVCREISGTGRNTCPHVLVLPLKHKCIYFQFFKLLNININQ